ncbi:protein of unknown function [Thauera humireducens]|nr:protein of unknown function [Thauera humireducens]
MVALTAPFGQSSSSTAHEVLFLPLDLQDWHPMLIPVRPARQASVATGGIERGISRPAPPARPIP